MTDIERPDMPPVAGAIEVGSPSVAVRLGRRLVARRWLLLVCGLVFAFFAVGTGLGWMAAGLGFSTVGVASALIPRDGHLIPNKSPERPRLPKQSLSPDVDDILQAIPDPAILLSGDGAVLAFNDKAEDHYPALRRDTHISSFIRHPEVLEALTGVSAGTGPITVTYGERVPVERRIAASLAELSEPGIRGEDSSLVLLCLHDLTEQERINQMRSDFIANASHELRTPLAAVAGFIETLQGPARDDPDARERFLKIMGEQAARMSRLIDDLLSLSRVEMNVHLLPSGQVDVAETVRYVADMLEPLAKNADVALHLEVPEEPVLVQGDRDELVQVFQNLIQNAIKYSRAGDHTRVTVAQSEPDEEGGARIAVSVADTGPGIAPEHLPRLTERFYRVDVDSSRKKGGTGLGLAIVKHVVNRHRGELKIVSEREKGSTFTVLLDAIGTPVEESEEVQDLLPADSGRE